MSEPKLPTTASVQEALDAFEAVWEFVAKKDRAELIRERNDVRRILVMVLNYLKAASERPTLNAALPDDAAAGGGDEPGGSEPPPSKRGRSRGMQVDADESEEEMATRLAPLRQIVDLILALEIEQRETLFDILEVRFCFDCGEAFRNERESRRHRCVFEDEEDGDDEDEEDDEDGEDEDEGDEADDESAAEIASERDA